MTAEWQKLEHIGRQAWGAVTHHHYAHPYQPEVTVSDTLHAAMYDEITAIFDDAKLRAQATVSRYLGDPHNLLSAVADFIDAQSAPLAPAALPQAAEPVQPADADADPAA